MLVGIFGDVTERWTLGENEAWQENVSTVSESLHLGVMAAGEKCYGPRKVVLSPGRKSEA